MRWYVCRTHGTCLLNVGVVIVAAVVLIPISIVGITRWFLQVVGFLREEIINIKCDTEDPLIPSLCLPPSRVPTSHHTPYPWWMTYTLNWLKVSMYKQQKWTWANLSKLRMSWIQGGMEGPGLRMGKNQVALGVVGTSEATPHALRLRDLQERQPSTAEA